jgi:hypothetical protein
MEIKNATFDMFMAKGNSVRPLPKLVGMPAESSFGSLELGSSPRKSNPITLPEGVIFNPQSHKPLSDVRGRSGRSPTDHSVSPSFVAVRAPSFERRDSGRGREASSITNLKHFLYKFFRNESVFPVPPLSRHELGLLSSVLTRKYGKPINFK